jgi:hypothetical protein
MAGGNDVINMARSVHFSLERRRGNSYSALVT